MFGYAPCKARAANATFSKQGGLLILEKAGEFHPSVGAVGVSSCLGCPLALGSQY